MNGGVGTIETVHKLSAGLTDAKNPSAKNSLEKRVPIVVVEGSGKAADFIACTWNHFHGEASSHVTLDSRAMKDKIDCRLCMGPGCVYSTCIMLSSNMALENVECQYLKARFEECFGTSVLKDKYKKLVKQVVEAGGTGQIATALMCAKVRFRATVSLTLQIKECVSLKNGILLRLPQLPGPRFSMAAIKN